MASNDVELVQVEMERFRHMSKSAAAINELLFFRNMFMAREDRTYDDNVFELGVWTLDVLIGFDQEQAS